MIKYHCVFIFIFIFGFISCEHSETNFDDIIYEPITYSGKTEKAEITEINIDELAIREINSAYYKKDSPYKWYSIINQVIEYILEAARIGVDDYTVFFPLADVEKFDSTSENDLIYKIEFKETPILTYILNGEVLIYYKYDYTYRINFVKLQINDTENNYSFITSGEYTWTYHDAIGAGSNDQLFDMCIYDNTNYYKLELTTYIYSFLVVNYLNAYGKLYNSQYGYIDITSYNTNPLNYPDPWMLSIIYSGVNNAISYDFEFDNSVTDYFSPL